MDKRTPEPASLITTVFNGSTVEKRKRVNKRGSEENPGTDTFSRTSTSNINSNRGTPPEPTSGTSEANSQISSSEDPGKNLARSSAGITNRISVTSSAGGTEEVITETVYPSSQKINTTSIRIYSH